jgi:uncharacterized membrane protein YraQ (UPF0718 family)/copper chaperone CopZ
MFDTIYNLICKVILESWTVLGEMSPYLLFGFLMAGVLSIVFSPAWIERHLGGRGFGPVVKASLLGVPLPLCSCGVIPVSASIRRHGASRAATISFVLSTPQTGMDNISVVWGLLGPVFAIFSPFAALITGLLGGGLVHWFGEKDPLDEAGHPIKTNGCAESCCAGKENRNFVQRAVQFGFLTLPRDIGVSLLVGILIAGTINAILPPNALKPYFGNEILSILMMIAAGIPLYVCATASVPIAASLIYMGASPGAALAFLIAGPATNAATISTIWKMLGKRSAFLYLLTIALSAVLCGLLLNWLMSVITIHLPDAALHVQCHQEEVGWISHFWAIVLLSVFSVSYFWPASVSATSHDHERENEGRPKMDEPASEALEHLEIQITGMTCGHCTAAVARAIRECEGVRKVEVDLKTGRATVEGLGVERQKLLDAIRSLGYEATI